MKKFLSLALSVLMLLSLLTGCGGGSSTDDGAQQDGGSETAETGGKLVVYSALNEDNTIAMAEQFEKDTGIEVEYISLGGGDAVARVQAEMSNPQADFLVGGSVDLYGSLAEAGALLEYDSPNNDDLDARFNDPNHLWQGWYMGVLSIIINEERFQEELASQGLAEPATWDDLLDPRWNGQIVMTDPGSSGSIKYFVGALMNSPAYGTAYFERLRENGCMLESNSTATHLQVAHGTYAVGICMDYIVSNMEEAGEPISFRLPERDTVPIYSPMGLVAGCPNERNGRLLYDYILSKEGQTILTEHHLHSIRDDLGNTPDFIQTVLDSRLPVNEQEISDTMEDVMDRFDRIFFQD